MKTKIIGVFVSITFILANIPIVCSYQNIVIINSISQNYPWSGLSINWTMTQKLLASDGADWDRFGTSVSCDHDIAIIGAPEDDSRRGSTYIFIRTGTTWVQQTKLLASDGISGDKFGCSVSLDGNTALIGAYLDNDNGNCSGSAYVFTRSGNTWTQQAKLLASDGDVNDQFGSSVSVSGDTALISSKESRGAAYLFTRVRTTWIQQEKLSYSESDTGYCFGISVSLSGDTALIGASRDDDNGFQSGSAFVYAHVGSTWILQQKLLALDGEQWAYFGTSVSLDGNTALIGAIEDDNDLGSAYVFYRAGTTWIQQAKLHAADGDEYDEFGGSVSLDGDTALIGAQCHNAFYGAAYVFHRIQATWTQQTKFIASDGAAGDRFGSSVALDDNTAFIGVANDCDNGFWSGSTYVFVRNGENLPPHADFSWAPPNPSPNQPISFDASASQDHDGIIIFYQWDWNNDGIYEENHSTPTTIYSWTSAGMFPITLRVIDNNETISTLSKIIYVENTPPNPPTITGPAKGNIKVEIDYNFTTIDPNDDAVYYLIDWGDGINDNWVGPYSSGDLVQRSHTWTKKGMYTIRAKAKDIGGNESSWGTFTITAPYSFNMPFLTLLYRLFERFPHVFPILRQVLAY
jgi:hypothetical protein